MINYIEIQNFKSIKEMKLELAPINILIGANGSGKSNFISFFKLLSSIYNQYLQNYFSENYIDSTFYFGRKNSKFIYGKIFFDDLNSYYFRLNPSENEKVSIAIEGYGYKADRENDVHNYVVESNLKESKIKDSEWYRNKYIQWYIEGLKIFHFHDTSIYSSLRKSSDIDDNRYLKSDGGNLPSFLYYLKQKEPISFKRIEKSIQTIAPFFKEFILFPDARNENLISLRWRHSEDLESNFGVSQLSDGTLRFIALATLLLQPNPPKVIIIDEPELGLHPFAINKLAGFIKSVSAKSQVIVSTQSPSLISNFSPDDILVVEMSKKEKQSKIYHLDSDELTSWLEEYTLGDLWKYNKLGFGQPFSQK